MRSPRVSMTLWLLVAATFVSVIGFGIILPVLPLFVTERGVPLSWLGFLTASSMGVSFVLQIPLGRLSDRVGRRPVMSSGLVAVALGTIGFVLRLSPLGYLFARAVQGAGNAAVTPTALAMVADVTPPEHRARSYGLLSSGNMAGFVIGPMLGGLLASLGGLDWTFGVGATLSLVSAVMMWMLPKDRPHKHAAPQPLLTMAARLWPFMVLNFGWYGLIGIYDTVMSIYLHHLGASVGVIGFAFGLFGLPMVLLAVPGGRMADRSGNYERLALIGALANAIVVVGYALIHNLWLAIANSTLEAVVLGLFLPSFQACIGRHAAKDALGAAQGAAGAAGTFGAFLSALAAGALLNISVWTPFWLGAGLTFSCAVLASFGVRSLMRRRASDGPQVLSG